MKITNAFVLVVTCAVLIVSLTVPVQAYDKTDPVHQNFGRSFESAKFKQIINHEPVENKVMEDLDGQAAIKVMEQYRNSFKQDVQVDTGGISELGGN
jgi:hypothetical protein